MDKHHIAIIGCGYIGTEVAALWSKKGYHITATTRHTERLTELSHVAQKSVILKGIDEEEMAPLISANKTLLITVAADNSDHYESAYLHTAQLLRHLALQMDMPRRLIYTSSTSVYGDHKGQWVDEGSELLAESDQAKILMEAERIYLSLQELGWHVTILRLAEIYGPGREFSHKVKEMKGYSIPGSGDQYTNMAHQADIVAAIDYSLRHHLEGVFNIADDDHQTRKELYHMICHKYHLPEPKWDPTLTEIRGGNKRVSNHKIKGEGFVFRHPHRQLDYTTTA